MDNNEKKEFEEMKTQLAGFREIHETFVEIMSDISHEEKGELICRQFMKISESRETALFLLDTKTDSFQFHAAAGKRARKYAGGVLQTGELEHHAPLESYLHTSSSQDVTILIKNSVHAFSDQFIMIVPVIAASKVYGIFFCDYDNSFTIDDSSKIELLRVFLNQLSPHFKHQAETVHLEEKAKSLKLIYEISKKLSSIRDENKLLDTIMELIEEHMQVDRCSLMIMDEDRKHLRIKKSFGMPNVDVKKVKVPVGEGIAGYVAAGTRPLLIKDLSAEKHLIGQVSQRKNYQTNSLLSVPLLSQGEVIGIINVNNRKDGLPFSEADMELLCSIGSEIAIILQRSYIALQLKKARELDRDIKRFMV